MKANHFKILFFAFSLLFVLFSCEKDFFQEAEITTTQSRPKNNSDIVSVEDVKDVAISFLNLNKDESKIDITKDDIKEVQTIANEDETPIMYAVNLNEDNGFVVISASFLERPILAYGENGNFDFDTIDEYNGVVDWAYTTYLTINQCIENKEEPDEEVIEQWQSFGYQEKVPPCEWIDGIYTCPEDPNWYVVNVWYENETKEPLLTTTWDQYLRYTSNLGYNNFVRFNNCPQGTSPAGCVAVAMGQIMKYHNYPNIYNINTMLSKVDTTNCLTSEAINIAYLLKNIGTKVNMNYSCYSSGAYSSDARTAFVNNYGYNASTLLKTSYSSVKQSLDNNLPVYLDGCRNRIINTKRIKPDIFGWIVESPSYTYSSCHAWVVDGFKQIKKVTQYASGRISKKYTSNGLVHCNWGWGSSINNMNNWYYFGTWNTYQNVNYIPTNFIYQQHMIHNIKPKNN